MKRAVEVMHDSVPERRKDGKASPLVGAVLVKADGKVDTCARGELRDGDHAEFGLLERKNRSQHLDGAKLFTTLEPCAPGARKAPKLSCAERIVLARVKEVWIGVEDPDPTVDRKGIKYLQDSGVTVYMFDRDLQEVILEANGKFIAQAEQRAEEAEKQPAPVVLSPLENTHPATTSKDFSIEALEAYRKQARIEDRVGTDAFNRRLLHQGLLHKQGSALVPTGFGLVLFGEEPRTQMLQAGLLGTIHWEDGEELADFDGPAVFIPDRALTWLRDKLPNPIDRTRAQRREVNEPFFELLREGIVNALVHRDYSIEGAKCQVRATPEKVVVSSPGAPVSPITLAMLQAFDAPMLSRNPALHFVFARMKLAEERGLGLVSMRERAARAGLPPPSYAWRPPYLELTLYQSARSVVAATDEKLLAELSKAERTGWEWLTTRRNVTSAGYAKAMKVPVRTALNHLKRMTRLGLLKKIGAGPTTRYEVIPP